MREMEEELKIFIKVWISALISVTYCYYITPRIKAGVFRLLSIIPVCALFLVLPLFLSSAQLCFATTIFLSWLANFKLILFAFDQGPLSPLPSNLSHFICFTCFPIMPQQNSKPHQHPPKFRFAIKLVLFVVALRMYVDRLNLPRILLWGLYALHLYLSLEMLFGLIKVVVSVTLGCKLEPQFNEPYLATSLQDFWGRRWNRMSSGTLRSAIYDPVRRVSERLVSSDMATFIGVLTSFLVSGLAHELIFFYLTRKTPTWEVTLFFVLHGVFTVVEALVKRTAFVRRRGLDRLVIPVVSQLLTVGFVVLTAGWLFFPQHERSGVFERFTDETLLSINFVKLRYELYFGTL